MTTAGALAVALLGVDAGRRGGELVFQHGAAVSTAAHPPGGSATAAPAGGRDED
jgi:hypothetical protein